MTQPTAPSAAERALAQNARFLDRCCRLAGVGACEWWPASGQLVVSDAACELLGLPAGRVPTLAAVLGAFGPDGAAMLDAALQRAAEQGQGWDVELPCGTGRVLRVVGRADAAVAGADAGTDAEVGAEGSSSPTGPVSLVLLDVTEPAAVRAELERALDRLDLATHSGGVGVWDWDLTPGPRAGRLTWDDAMWRLHGETARPAGLDLAAWRRRLLPPDRRAAAQVLRAALREGAALDGEWCVTCPDGELRVLRWAGRVLRHASGRPVRVAGVCWDVSEPRRLQQQLQEQRELLETTLQSIGDAVLTTDAQGRVTWLNPVAQRLTGWRADDAQGQPAAHVFVTELPAASAPAGPGPGEGPAHVVGRCLRDGQVTPLAAAAVLVSRDGRRRAVDASVAPIRHGGGAVRGTVLVFRDVTQQRRQFDEIRWHASHDSLTGLVNRAEFAQRLNRALERSRRDGSHHAVLALDLDRFKQVNDLCGHAAGDAVLCEVARRLQAGVRGRDTVARLGGDEFAALLENCGPDEAERVAEALCRSVAQVRHEQGPHRVQLGVSIGVAALGPRAATADAVLQQADAACLAAKAAGRNRVQLVPLAA
ncbi:diguanylate cyclase domain-containing protein [Roseateles sp. BYS87W]|uniref:Diguanylate cyclase domain-containing protein n=1 Tax=Pelomonas baiyunensis TaxID=3299026 RepID=A0ABW7H0B3_9BURK